MPAKNPESCRAPMDNLTASRAANTPSNSLPRAVGRLTMKLFRRIGRFLWYSLKKASYVVFLIVVVVIVLLALDKAAEMALKGTHLTYVHPEDFAMVKRDLTKPVSHYDYDLTPGVCFRDVQVKGNRYEYANNAGFRDPRPISLKKPDDEFRIFLTGGSTAFGLGAGGQAGPITNFYYLEHRETIAHGLEKILNTMAPIPGKTIRVYNTAVWGYAYQHLLLRYVTKLRQYKPDLIVSLDGVNELLPVSVPAKEWDYFSQGQFNGILRQMFDYDRDGLASYLTLWLKNNTFLMTFFWKGVDPFQTMEGRMRERRGSAPGKDVKDVDPSFSSEDSARMVKENISTVVRVLEDYHSVLENDSVPHIFAMQPLLYLSKKPRHAWEKKVESVEEHKEYYLTPVDKLYELMIERINESARKKQYFLADFSNYFDDTSEWVFTDWCHLTAGANYLIAKELANILKEKFFEKSLTEGDRIMHKNSYFWNLALTAKVVYAPPADDPANGTENMLTGYPGAAGYASKDVAPEDRLEIVLDLTREFSLSRVRLVWDESWVPKEWAVDVSADGVTWKAWVKGTSNQVDQFSWWPGYEFYSSEPAQARFLRYRPVNTDKHAIRLRSLNVYR
jgi:hypothetical protein